MGAKLSQINTKALDFIGTSEWLENAAEVDLGFGANWTIFLCAWTNGSGRVPLSISEDVGDENRIRIIWTGTVNLNHNVYNSSGSLRSNSGITSTLTGQKSKQWNYFALSWDGTTLLASVAGLTFAITAPNPTLLTMTSTSRRITIGADAGSVSHATPFVGLMGDVALWSSALSQAELNWVTANGAKRDLRYDEGDYASAADLIRYLRCGMAAGASQSGGTFVCDDATNGAGVDVAAGATGLDATDIIDASHPQPSGYCLDFNGADEYLRMSANVAHGLTDSFTIMVIAESDRDTTDETIWSLQTSVSDNNSIKFAKQGAQAGDYAQLTMYGSTGVLLRDYRWDNAFPTGTWKVFVITRDGAAANDPTLLYIDGTLATPDATPTQVNGSMTNLARRTGIACSARAATDPFDGRIHSVVCWSKVLSAAQVAVISSAYVNPCQPQAGGDYGSADDLGSVEHWFRLGLPAPTWAAGSTYAHDATASAAGTMLDPTTGALNVSDADIVTNDPPTL